MRFKITPLFNTAVDPDGRPAFARFGEEYRPGDTLAESKHPAFARGIEIEADAKPEALELVFRLMNDDDRPNGQLERSLSVGDVLLVEWDGNREAHYCAGTGWTPTVAPKVRRPRPDYDPHLDHPERYADGPV